MSDPNLPRSHAECWRVAAYLLAMSIAAVFVALWKAKK